MKLNYDCMREILLRMEACAYEEILPMNSLMEQLPQYTYEELQYNSHKLFEAGLIHALTTRSIGTVYPHIVSLVDITYDGHQFLAKIRDDKRWNLVKKGAHAVRDYSLSAISSIAEGITSAAIHTYFSGNLNP